jgi:hypothetical protein
MLIVSSYESPSMAKQNFGLVIGLWNWQITSLRFNNQCWSSVKVVQIVIGGGEVTYSMLLFSSSQHYKNPRGPFVKWGREKNYFICGIHRFTFEVFKKKNCSKKTFVCNMCNLKFINKLNNYILKHFCFNNLICKMKYAF